MKSVEMRGTATFNIFVSNAIRKEPKKSDAMTMPNLHPERYEGLSMANAKISQ
jgi:hypothetical protein